MVLTGTPACSGTRTGRLHSSPDCSPSRPSLLAPPRPAPRLVVLGDLSRHPGADDGLLGYLRVHRGRQGAGHSPSAGQPALHAPGARRSALLPLAASYAGADQPLRGGHQRRRRRGSGSWSPTAGCAPSSRCGGPGYGAAFAGILVSATSVDGVEPVHREREGVHRLAALDRAGDVARASTGATTSRGQHRDRWLVLIAYVLALSSTNHMMGVLAGAGRGGLRPVDRLARGPQAVACSGRGRSVAARRSGISLNYSSCRSGRPVPADQRGRADRLLQPGAERRAQPVSTASRGSTSARPTCFVAVRSNYWQYCRWQFARDWGGWSRIATALFTTLGLVGVVTLLAHRPSATRPWPLGVLLHADRRC